MRSQLFHESVESFAQEKIRDAVNRASAMSEVDLGNPDAVNAASGAYRFDFASLKPDQRYGKRRSERRQVRDFGQARDVEVKVIDVYIPFDGWAKSFTLCPSQSEGMMANVRIEGSEIVVTLPDDDVLDQAVNILIKQISSNLDVLRRDMGQIPERIRDAVTRVIESRREELAAQRALDAKRSFPIR